MKPVPKPSAKSASKPNNASGNCSPPQTDREQVATLINGNLQNVDDAEIRYNSVVGDNIKYLYVTEQQQQDLADGALAITFLGKRCLIPLETAQQILALDPDKLVVINTQEEPLTPSPLPPQGARD